MDFRLDNEELALQDLLKRAWVLEHSFRSARDQALSITASLEREEHA